MASEERKLNERKRKKEKNAMPIDLDLDLNRSFSSKEKKEKKTTRERSEPSIVLALPVTHTKANPRPPKARPLQRQRPFRFESSELCPGAARSVRTRVATVCTFTSPVAVLIAIICCRSLLV